MIIIMHSVSPGKCFSGNKTALSVIVKRKTLETIINDLGGNVMANKISRRDFLKGTIAAAAAAAGIPRRDQAQSGEVRAAPDPEK